MLGCMQTESEDANSLHDLDSYRARYGLVGCLADWPHGQLRPRYTSAADLTVPEIGAVPNNAYGRLVRHGRDLITATYAHIGPEVSDPSKRFAGNNLACSNCHLQAGTKKFGIQLFGLFGVFPRYSTREGVQITIEDRLNSCMTRSMNGRALPVRAMEMQAMGPTSNFCHRRRPRSAAAWHGHRQNAGARSPCRSCARRKRLRQNVRGMSRSEWHWHST